jgi:hypothetical protein
MGRIKNPDVAAIVAMVSALGAEVISQIANDESLLGQLPPWLGPFLLAVAASLRIWSGKSSASQPDALSEAESAVETEAP